MENKHFVISIITLFISVSIFVLTSIYVPSCPLGDACTKLYYIGPMLTTGLFALISVIYLKKSDVKNSIATLVAFFSIGILLLIGLPGLFIFFLS